MTMSDVERRLAHLMDERAEGAMNETNTPEKLTALMADEERHEQSRRRAWQVGAAVAAAAAVAVTVWLARGDDRVSEPQPAAPSDAQTVATDFLENLYPYNPDAVDSLLADGTVIDWAVDLEDWRRELAWRKAAGYAVADHACDEGSTTVNGTEVHCAFTLHALGSDRLERGPYGDNTVDLTVQDGKITLAAEDLTYFENGFSDEMWVPLASYVARTFPEDATVMYNDDRTQPKQSAESLRLWTRHITDYVAYMNS